MNTCQKFLATSLLALFASAAFAQTVTLGAASGFSVLGGTAVTCTDGVIIGDAGVSPGTAFTNTRCTISGTTHVDDRAARRARAAFDAAYAALDQQACQFNLPAVISRNAQLEPGVYCTEAALTATDVVLTLDGKGDPNAVWIFRVGTNLTGALTGTGFTVSMIDGGQACNVYWRVAEAVGLTDSVFKGTVLAGAAITTTRGTVAGRALARAAVTITGTTVTGCDVLSENGVSCKPKRHHKHKKGHDDDDDDDDDDRGHGNGGDDDDDDDDK